jgi:hypothetical protein
MRSTTSNSQAHGTATPELKPFATSLPPLLLSEYGLCGAQDYPRFLRHFEQLGKEHAADATLFRNKFDLFLADWKKYKLDDCWAQPEDYFTESQRNQAKLVAWGLQRVER